MAVINGMQQGIQKYATSYDGHMQAFNKANDLYKNICKPLDDMENVGDGSLFKFLAFGSNCDDLTTKRPIDASGLDEELKQEFWGYFNQVKQEYNTGDTGYEFKEERDEEGNVYVPYLVFIEMANKIVATNKQDPYKCNKLLGVLESSINKDNAERRDKAETMNYVFLFIGGVGMMITLTNIGLPHIVELSEKGAKLSNILQWIGIGITCIGALSFAISKITGAFKKTDIETQLITIKSLKKDREDLIAEINKSRTNALGNALVNTLNEGRKIQANMQKIEPKTVENSNKPSSKIDNKQEDKKLPTINNKNNETNPTQIKVNTTNIKDNKIKTNNEDDVKNKNVESLKNETNEHNEQSNREINNDPNIENSLINVNQVNKTNSVVGK